MAWTDMGEEKTGEKTVANLRKQGEQEKRGKRRKVVVIASTR